MPRNPLTLLSPRNLTAADAVANLTSAVVTARSAEVWRLLNQPEPTRRPVAAALLASGLWHTAGLRPGGPSRGHLAVAATINAAWAVAGGSTQTKPLYQWQRWGLGAIAAYDVAMCALKARAALRG